MLFVYTYSYAVEGNNEPIIPEEIFSKVQEERTHRSNVEVDDDGVKRRKSTKYSAKKSKISQLTLLIKVFRQGELYTFIFP